MSSVQSDLRGQSSLTAKQEAEGSNLYHQQSQVVCPCHEATETSSAPGMQTFNEDKFLNSQEKKKQIPPTLLTSSSHNSS